MEKKKIYILDTNVLVHDPQSIFSFERSNVGIPLEVLEELDKFKTESTQKGFNSREVIRQLDILRSKGSLGEGIPLDNGGSIRVLFPVDDPTCQIPLRPDVLDNLILKTAYCMQVKEGYDVRFISKDLNARVKADALGIQAFDYLKDSVNKDSFYKGWIVVQVPSVQLKKEIPDELNRIARDFELTVNEYVLLESKGNPHNNALFRYSNNKFKRVLLPNLKWPLVPRNPQQLMALDSLLDNNIQLVTLLGPAGTGKTFLALLAGLHKVLIEHDYEKMLVTRPVIPLGPDIGYLPGDIHEKLHSWMQPIYDNMDFITHSINAANEMAVYKEEEPVRPYGRFKGRKSQRQRVIPSLDELVKEGKISLEAITYMRGRSIPYQFILIDEVQNLTPHEVKTLVSRVGEGSKVILAGDPYQIDSPYLDFSSNGLVVATSRFKGQPIFSSVFLETSERSELSKLAAQLM